MLRRASSLRKSLDHVAAPLLHERPKWPRHTRTYDLRALHIAIQAPPTLNNRKRFFGCEFAKVLVALTCHWWPGQSIPVTGKAPSAMLERGSPFWDCAMTVQVGFGGFAPSLTGVLNLLNLQDPACLTLRLTWNCDGWRDKIETFQHVTSLPRSSALQLRKLDGYLYS